MKNKSGISMWSVSRIAIYTCVFALASCGGNRSYMNYGFAETPTVDYVEALDVYAAPHKDSFLNQLAMNYRSYAIYNARTSGYSEMGELFANKAISAFAGDVPFPESLDSWPIQNEQEAFELHEAYNGLMDQLKNDASYTNPELAAEAQAKFDCWLSATATGQYATADQCRERFEKTMVALRDCYGGKIVNKVDKKVTATKTVSIKPEAAEELQYYPETHELMARSTHAREGVIVVNNVTIPEHLINPVPVQPMVFNQNIYGGDKTITKSAEDNSVINSNNTLTATEQCDHGDLVCQQQQAQQEQSDSPMVAVVVTEKESQPIMLSCPECEKCKDCSEEKGEDCDSCKKKCSECEKKTKCSECRRKSGCGRNSECSDCRRKSGCDKKVKECQKTKECKKCKECPDCPECEKCKECAECPSCPDCPDCPNCPDCPSCPDCPNCPDCPTCPEQKECPPQKECPDCPKIEIPPIGDELVSRDEFINMMMAMRSELAAINSRLDEMQNTFATTTVDSNGEKTMIKVQQIPLQPDQHVMEEILEIRFDFNESNIAPEYKELIKKLATATQENKNIKVSVVGHTDTMGTANYNYALGGRRAEAVQKMLIKYGIPASQIVAVSAGEEGLAVPTPDNTPNSDNRRVRIVKEIYPEETEQPGTVPMEIQIEEIGGVM